MMKAWMIERISSFTEVPDPIKLHEVPIPKPGKGEVLLRVHACGICHTEIDEIEGRTSPSFFPIIPGHQVIGTIADAGKTEATFHPGERFGVAWIYSSCGKCHFCQSGQENLCPDFRATGRDVHGGYAEFMVANENFIYSIPSVFSDAEAAPLLCAGAIGYRSLRLTEIGNNQILGLTGFGASAHLVLKMARFLYPQLRIFVFARRHEEREFALALGAHWAGDTCDTPPEPPDAIIDTTPAWKPVLYALKALSPGGRLVINAIRKETSDLEILQNINYSEHLWMEKEIKSVANVVRRDVKEFLALASRIPIKPEIDVYQPDQINQALNDLKNKHIRGAKVLCFDH